MYTLAPSPSFGISEHPFVTWENGFSEEELNKIVEFCETLPKEKAIVGGSKPEDDITDVRESSVSWVFQNNETVWIYDRLAWAVRQLNGQFYKFDLYGFSENIQYTVYNSETNGHYTWHLDNGITNNGMPPRKFSVVLQLSDPKEYEGGDLEVFVSGEPTKILKSRGLIAAFPSYTLHRVTPVTSGIRRTLVLWVCGPSFK